MNKLIVLLFLLVTLLQPIPPCNIRDRRRYIVAPICEPQPVKPIAPITIHG